MILFILSLLLLGYLLGSIPVGYLLANYAGVGDLRASGSGSTGATNVVRQAGWRLGLLTVVLDIAKGALTAGLPAILVWVMSGEWNPQDESAPIIAFFACILATAAIIGHIFPVWLRFKGGKGVATYFGTLLVVMPSLGLSAVAIWILVALITRYSSLGSILAVCALPFMAFAVERLYGQPYYLWYLFVPTLLLLFTHRANIKRLVRGQEPRISLNRKNAS
ncbi:MAG: glycerol-3-phosphate 1-O-acyltransferase PlsY [Alphaproteobacteria bacterium]|nr:glycerol-3-phosphate 1-O-acyltransferase PlsY [Alphaproteobacteria bacterium]